MKFYYFFPLLLLFISCDNFKKKPTLITFSGKVLGKDDSGLMYSEVKIFDGSKYLTNKKNAKTQPVTKKDGSFNVSINIPEKEIDYEIYVLYEKEGYVPRLCSLLVHLSKIPTTDETQIKLEDIALLPLTNFSHDESLKKIKVYEEANLEAKVREFDTEEYVVLSNEMVDSTYYKEMYKNDHFIVASGKWLKIVCSKNLNEKNDTVFIFFNDALAYKDAIKCYEPYIQPVQKCNLYASADDSSKILNECKIDSSIGLLIASEVRFVDNRNSYWYKVDYSNCRGWIKADSNYIRPSKKHECLESSYLWTL